MKLPKVNIIIPAYRESSEVLVEGIWSLLNLDYPNDKYRIIVVKDKAASKEVNEVLDKLKDRVTVLQSPGRGSANNRNHAINHIDKDAKYLAFTDADCIADKKWLRVLVNTIENHEADVVGGINPAPRSNLIQKGISIMENTFLGGAGSAQGTLFRNLTWVASIPNCNAMYKKELWLDNKQNPKLIVGQDGEFNLRLRKQGAKFLINPEAKIYHHRPENISVFKKRIVNYGKATANLFKLHTDLIVRRWYGFIPPLFVLSVIGLVILSFIHYVFAFLLGFALIAYFMAILLTAIEGYLKSKRSAAFTILYLLPLQHLFYAYGFFKGVIGL